MSWVCATPKHALSCTKTMSKRENLVRTISNTFESLRSSAPTHDTLSQAIFATTSLFARAQALAGGEACLFNNKKQFRPIFSRKDPYFGGYFFGKSLIPLAQVYLYQWDYTPHAGHADDIYYVLNVPAYSMVGNVKIGLREGKHLCEIRKS